MKGAQWLAEAVEKLSTSPSPEVDAELLLGSVIGVERHLLRQSELSEAQYEQANRLLQRRAQGEPVQYLTGQAPYRYLTLHVGPGVLIPRPETELIVDRALEEIARGARDVIDLGAGAGPLSIALASESPARVTAVEREESALVWLRRNVDEFAPQVTVIASDVVALTEENAFDIVVANPPYLPDGAVLAVEVVDHEPSSALWGGGDGTEVPSLFIDAASRLLRPGGLLLLEHSDQHQDAIMSLLSSWSNVEGHRDLAGRPRFVSARRVGVA